MNTLGCFHETYPMPMAAEPTRHHAADETCPSGNFPIAITPTSHWGSISMKPVLRRAQFPLLATTATMALAVAGCSSDDDQARSDGWPDSLRMAVVASTDTVGIDELYGPNAELIEEEFVVEIQLRAASGYAGVIEATLVGNADIVGFGALPSVLTTMNDAPIEAIAVGLG